MISLTTSEQMIAQIAALDRDGKAPRVRRFVAAPQGHSAEVTASPTDPA